MLERNRFLIDNTHFVLAIYNGEQQGSTAASEELSRQAQMPKDLVGKFKLRESAELSEDSGVQVEAEKIEQTTLGTSVTDGEY